MVLSIYNRILLYILHQILELGLEYIAFGRHGLLLLEITLRSLLLVNQSLILPFDIINLCLALQLI